MHRFAFSFKDVLAILVPVSLVMLALVTIVFFFRQMVGEWHFWQKNVVTTTGKVIHITVSTESNRSSTYTCDNPTIQFRLPNERVITFEPQLYSCNYQVGEQVTVVYDPQDPQNARVDLGDASGGFWHILITTVISWSIILIIGIFLIWLLLSIVVSGRE
jgi:hypothetical protein